MRPPAHPLADMPLTCLGRTCLQWRPDGELIDDDRNWVLQRLRLVDPLLVDPLLDATRDPLLGSGPTATPPPA